MQLRRRSPPPLVAGKRLRTVIWWLSSCDDTGKVRSFEVRSDMPQPPQLSEEQRQQALAKAAEARRVRAEVKELLKTGSMTVSELLARAESDEIVAGLKVESLLSSLPGTGKIKAKRLMESLGIAENRRVRGLGEKQKEALLKELS